MTGRGHGWQETRTTQALPAPDGIWPYARQVFLVERYVYDLAGTLTSAVGALGLTALTAAQASPERLNWLVRDHWGIEPCTGCATPSSVKTTPSSAAAQRRRSWPACGTSPPASSTPAAVPRSPLSCAG